MSKNKKANLSNKTARHASSENPEHTNCSCCLISHGFEIWYVFSCNTKWLRQQMWNNNSRSVVPELTQLVIPLLSLITLVNLLSPAPASPNTMDYLHSLEEARLIDSKKNAKTSDHCVYHGLNISSTSTTTWLIMHEPPSVLLKVIASAQSCSALYCLLKYHRPPPAKIISSHRTPDNPELQYVTYKNVKNLYKLKNLFANNITINQT